MNEIASTTEIENKDPVKVYPIYQVCLSITIDLGHMSTEQNSQCQVIGKQLAQEMYAEYLDQAQAVFNSIMGFDIKPEIVENENEDLAKIHWEISNSETNEKIDVGKASVSYIKLFDAVKGRK